MAMYSIIAILSVCTGAIFTYLYRVYYNNPILITLTVLIPIAIGYYNTNLGEDSNTLRKVFLNMSSILLSFILTAITAMLVNAWV